MSIANKISVVFSHGLLRAAGPSPDEHETLFHPSLDTLASLSETDFNQLFRLSPLKRAKYRGWLT